MSFPPPIAWPLAGARSLRHHCSALGTAVAARPAQKNRRSRSTCASASSRTSPTRRRSSASREGSSQKALGKNTLETKTFNAGPEEITALLAGALDIGYIGPNPSVNAYVQSNGEAVRVVGGATSGGAYLVVKPDITKASDLKGKKLATPQLGNTQDVALRTWLKKQGLKTDTQGGGDVSIVPQENALTLDAFKQNQIAGAWVPEPWATRLITEGGGKILVDERTLWPEGKYVTTNIIVRTQFLEDHPDVVKQVLQGNLDAIDFIKTNRATGRSRRRHADPEDHERSRSRRTW